MKLWLRTNPVFPVLFPLVHELVNPVNEGLHVFLRPVLGETDAYSHIDLLARYWDEYLSFELRQDSFRCNDAVFACGHRKENGELFSTVTIGSIRLAQALFNHLAEPHQYLIPLYMP